MPENLYVHFPFCRAKCAYCSLYSRTGTGRAERDAYAKSLAGAARGKYRTAYFGGGSPALADLSPLLKAVDADEFTVELHPLDVTDDLLARLADGGVNRISMGVQSLNDPTLAAMGRGYTAAEAERAFATVRRRIPNAGIDLIVGLPGDGPIDVRRLAGWGLRHLSAYSLINDRRLANVPDDDTVLDRIAALAEALRDLGLKRYEISNYAAPGSECRHNLAVWRGEDYRGLGEGASGREGRVRTLGVRGKNGVEYRRETLSEEEDQKERTIFRLRTREGLDSSKHPEWTGPLDRFVREGVLTRRGSTYFLTPRGTEVCDAVLTEIV